MTASHPRKSDHHTRCPSTGHGRTRPDTRLSSQIVRQLTEFDANRRSSSSQFTTHRLARAPRTPFTHFIRGTQIPIAQDATPTSPSRGFLPWRFAYAGPPVHAAPPSWVRHPQTFTEAAVRYPTGPSNDWVKKTRAKRDMLVDRRAPADRTRCDKRAFPSVRSHQSLPRPIRASRTDRRSDRSRP